MSTKSTKAKRIKETAYSFAESDACGRVTVSLDPKLLKIVDGLLMPTTLVAVVF